MNTWKEPSKKPRRGQQSQKYDTEWGRAIELALWCTVLDKKSTFKYVRKTAEKDVDKNFLSVSCSIDHGFASNNRYTAYRFTGTRRAACTRKWRNNNKRAREITWEAWQNRWDNETGKAQWTKKLIKLRISKPGLSVNTKKTYCYLSQV